MKRKKNKQFKHSKKAEIINYTHQQANKKKQKTK